MLWRKLSIRWPRNRLRISCTLAMGSLRPNQSIAIDLFQKQLLHAELHSHNPSPFCCAVNQRLVLVELVSDRQSGGHGVPPIGRLRNGASTISRRRPQPGIKRCALRCAHWPSWRMRTTLELPDPLFARLKARAASERVTLKQLLRSYVEQGLNASPERGELMRSAATLPRLDGALAIEHHQLSNAALFELLDP